MLISFSNFINENKRWGNVAGGVLPIATSTKRALLSYRSNLVLEPETWNIWSGKVDEEDGETENNIKEVIKREFKEETGYNEGLELQQLLIYREKKFKFYNFLGFVDEEFEPRLNYENEDYNWFNFEELIRIEPKHFGLENLLSDRYSLSIIKKYMK